MKKLLSLLPVLLIISATSFATPAPDPANKKVTETFIKLFANAESVQWQQTSTFIKAQFQLNGTHLSAYFTPDAEFMGVSRNLTSTQLPLYLLADLKKNYSQYWITELFEYASADADDYYVTLESAEKTIILKGNMNGFSVFKKSVN